jgi:hypothetical protein
LLHAALRSTLLRVGWRRNPIRIPSLPSPQGPANNFKFTRTDLPVLYLDASAIGTIQAASEPTRWCMKLQEIPRRLWPTPAGFWNGPATIVSLNQTPVEQPFETANTERPRDTARRGGDSLNEGANFQSSSPSLEPSLSGKCTARPLVCEANQGYHSFKPGHSQQHPIR